MQFQLNITAPEEAKPSEVVTLNIKTDPLSFVGLMAVDKSVLLMQTGNDFNEGSIFSDMDGLRSWAPEKNGRHSTYPGKDRGFVTLTNACYPHPSKLYNFYGYTHSTI